MSQQQGTLSKPAAFIGQRQEEYMTTWNKMESGVVDGALNSFKAALRESASEVLPKLRDDARFIAGLAEYAVKSAKFTDEPTARDLMGDRFFGLNECVRYLGAAPVSFGPLATLLRDPHIPFSAGELKSCQSSHVLVFIPPIPLREYAKIEKALGVRLLLEPENGRWLQEPFSIDVSEVGWHLVLAGPIRGSYDQTWKSQEAHLRPTDRTVSVQVAAVATMCYYLSTGRRLFMQTQGRCTNGTVGYFTDDGLVIGGKFNDNDRLGDMGLAAERVPMYA